MEKILNDYLEKIEKYLKPLPVSERVDIVKEIQSGIIELQGSGKNEKEIIERLGDPKELAKSYLGNLISKDKSPRWNRVLAVCAYYGLASLSGLIIIPVLAVCSPVFIFCGILIAILGVGKLLDSLMNLGIPYVQQIGVLGISNPIIVFVVCVLIGIVLCFVGRGCWKLLVRYIKGVNKVKDDLSI